MYQGIVKITEIGVGVLLPAGEETVVKLPSSLDKCDGVSLKKALSINDWCIFLHVYS